MPQAVRSDGRTSSYRLRSGAIAWHERPDPRRALITLAAVLPVLLSLATARRPVLADELVPLSERLAGIGRVEDFGTYVRLRHYAGDGVGNTDSFTTFGAFQPLWQDQGLWFLDGQFILANNAQVGGNAGLGYRFYAPESDRIWGASLWYDVDDRHAFTYQQVTVSLESLGQLVDFRTNVYAPVAETSHVSGGPGGGVVVFRDDQLWLSQSRFAERAMTGLDMELGTPVPGWLGEHSVRAYAGWYHYQADSAPQVYGAMGRVEGYLTPNVNLQLSITNDRLFDTNVVLGVTWTFPSGPLRGGLPTSVYDRLAAPVQRNHNVVVDSHLDYVPDVLLTDPVSGDPIHLVHAASGAGPGGDGSVQSPFDSLAAAVSAAQENEIVFVHANSTFAAVGDVQLKAGQRLLGAGAPHYITTAQGTLLLPGATTGPLPILNDARLIATSNTEISGLEIHAPAAQRAITGTGVAGNIDINHNTIVGGQTGVYLTSVTGNVSLANNTIRDTGIDGIFTDNIVGRITCVDNHFSNTGTRGVFFQQTTGDIDFQRNTISGAGDFGALLNFVSGNITFADNTVSDCGLGTGLYAVGGQIQYTGNTISDIAGLGAYFQTLSGGATMSGNTFRDCIGYGAQVWQTGSAATAFNVDNNAFCNNNGADYGFIAETLTAFSGTLGVNLSGNTSDDGYALRRNGGGSLQYYDGGQASGGVINLGGATQRFTPYP